MSFTIAYRPFAGVRCVDEDTGDGLTAFEFATTAACRRSIADHGLRCRYRDAGFDLYYRTNPRAADPLLGPISGPTRFSFAMHLRRPGWFSTYEPAFTDATGPNLYLDNLSPGGAILAGGALSAGATVGVDDAARIGRRRYKLQVDLTDPAPTALSVREAFSGDLVATVPVPGSGTRAEVAIDLRQVAGAVFTVEESPAGPPSMRIYPDDELAGAAASGVIDLHWDQPQNAVPAAGLAFVARFRRI